VVGSTSVKQAAMSPDLRETARQVGVGALIQGSVRAEDNKLQVTVRLLDGTTGSAVWSETYKGDRKKLFDMEEKIALSVADKLAVQAGMQPAVAVAPPDPRRVQVSEYYQQARALSSRDFAGPLDECSACINLRWRRIPPSRPLMLVLRVYSFEAEPINLSRNVPKMSSALARPNLSDLNHAVASECGLSHCR
jgi:hypothetical protein